MASAPVSLSIQAQAHQVNCLEWNDDRVIAVLQPSIAFLRVTPGDVRSVSHEISPSFSDFGSPQYACDTEDAICLPEQKNQERFVQVAHSPYGVSRHRDRLLAILTADRRCSIFQPVRDPEKHGWQVTHSVTKAAWERLGHDCETDVISSVTAIKHLRITSIAWTAAFFQPHSRWGESFFLTGNEAGEVLLYRVTWQDLDLVRSIKCAEHSITQLKAETWSDDGSLSIFATDSEGAVHLLSCHTTFHDNCLHIHDVSPCTKLRCSNIGLLSNLATMQHDGQSLIAVTSPGRVHVLAPTNSSATPSEVTRYELPFHGPTTGLSWLNVTDSQPILLILGSTGHIVALHYTSESHNLQIAEALTASLCSQRDEILKVKNDLAEPSKTRFMMWFHGAAVAPTSVSLAVSYTLVPENRIRYLIPSAHTTYFAFFTVTEDPLARLQALLTSYLHNPYGTSMSAVLSLHKKLGISVLSSINAVQAHGVVDQISQDRITLSSRLFGETRYNCHRLALISGELSPDLAAQIYRDIRNNFLQTVFESLETGKDDIGPRALQTLNRLAAFTVEFLVDAPALHTLARNVLRHLEHVRPPATNGNGMHEVHDSCPACGSELKIGETMYMAKCTQGHTFDCCIITLEVPSNNTARTCLGCGRKAVLYDPEAAESGFYARLLDACDMCYFCTGKWYSKF